MFKKKCFTEKQRLSAVSQHAASRRFAGLGAILLGSALQVSASTGTLAVTKGVATFAGELGILGYYICLGGIGVTAWDWYQHRSVGAVGWSGIGTAVTSGLVVSAPTLLGMMGATAMTV